MHDPRILQLIAARLSAKENMQEKEELNIWLEQSIHNRNLFEEVKKTWEKGGGEVSSLRHRFSKKNIVRGLIQETLSSLVGFIIGLWISNSFTHYVHERRSVRNLFGILGRKKKVVHDIPEWMQVGLSVLLGFIALELINYFFQSRSHIKIFNFIKKRIQNS